MSATDPIYSINEIDKEVLPQTANLNNKDLEDKSIYVIDRKTKEILEIPNLPVGYIEKNRNLHDFIKGLLNSKYFIG